MVQSAVLHLPLATHISVYLPMYNIASYVMEAEPGHVNSSILFRFESGHYGMKYHYSVNISYEFASDKYL